MGALMGRVSLWRWERPFALSILTSLMMTPEAVALEQRRHHHGQHHNNLRHLWSKLDGTGTVAFGMFIAVVIVVVVPIAVFFATSSPGDAIPHPVCENGVCTLKFGSLGVPSEKEPSTEPNWEWEEPTPSGTDEDEIPSPIPSPAPPTVVISVPSPPPPESAPTPVVEEPTPSPVEPTPTIETGM